MTKQHEPRLDRRTTLKWMLALMSTPALAGCDGAGESDAKVIAALGRALDIEGQRYGQDPNLVDPVVPWRRTMTGPQLQLTKSLADVFIPADEKAPSAGTVGAADFIDEWISAPYPQQMEDRALILTGLEDIEKRARRRHNMPFVELGTDEKTALVDDLMPVLSFLPASFDKKSFFARFRYLVVSAFYLTDDGFRDIGYIGNQPVMGPYPGPSEDALKHLQTVLDDLGLKMP